MENSNHLNSLNFFRALSGFGVCISHFFFYLNNIVFFEYLSFIFVEFFFILSGFVLTPQLLKIKNITNLKIFFLRRWIRTLPLFILCLIVFSILFNKFDSDTLKYLFLLQNIYPGFINFDYINVLWSLSIEEYFYIFFPIILLFFKDIKIFQITLAVIIFFLVLNLFFSFYLNTSDLRTNTFLRLDSISYGVMLFFLSKKNIKINTSLILLTTSLLLYYFYIQFLDKNFSNLETFFYIISLKIFSFCCCSIFIKKENFFSNFKNVGKFLANLVYSAYLFHLLFIYVLNFYSLNLYLSFFIYIVSILFFTFFIYNYFEKPLNALRPKYPD